MAATEVDKPKTSEEAQLGTDTDQGFQQQCLLFPTYATKHDSDGTLTEKWHVPVRGWAFEAPKGSTTRTLFLSVTSMMTGVHENDDAYKLLVERTAYFWKRNVKKGEFMVQTIGLTDPNKFAVVGDPNDLEGDEGGESPREQPQSGDVRGVVKRVKNFAQINFAKNSPDEMETIKIPAESGHCLGSISLPKVTVKKWMSEADKHDRHWFSIMPAAAKTKKSGSRLMKIQAYQTSSADPAYGVVNLIKSKGYSVISDIDDTIKDTEILAGAKQIFSNTFLQNFRDVPGMPELYRSWYDKGVAFHYVSNSPWQLFPSLSEFFQKYQFPPGSAHFKFYDGLIKSAREQKTNPMASKLMYIDQIFGDFPNRQFILVGDSGELDPEVYTTAVKKYPGRVARIFIRDVTTKHVKDLPPQQSNYSYLRTFPSMIRNLYKGDDEEAAKKAENIVDVDATKEPEKEQIVKQEVKSDTPRGDDSERSRSDRSPSFFERLTSDLNFLRKSTTREVEMPEGADEKATSGASELPSPPSTSNEDQLRTPLEMFKERIEKLRDEIEATGQPRDLLFLFTDAEQAANDEVINTKLAK